jgi:hypothetical protein
MITYLAALAAAIGAPAHFALIATNNRSLDLTRPDLRYADDDGVKYAELFGELAGAENVYLLTELDFESKRLYPGWVERVTPPTIAELDRAVEALARAARARKARGERVEVHVVLAGHGDIDRGQGYVELADARLTSTDLEERILLRLEVDRVHLILDSCNSYFMLNPRKPGARRYVASAQDSQALLERYPHVGALVSTSAEAVTYEWSELQSGIFSYEVRSGLRGAADADADGRITYLELAAFLYVANRSIPNELYRPKVYTRAPNGRDDEPLLTVSSSVLARTLHLSKGTARRLTIRDSLGVRVMDVHKDAGAELILRLPAGTGELGVYELITGGERPEIVFRTITTSTLSAAAPPALGARGEAPVFEKLFAEPFGPAAIDEYRSAAAREQPVYGVSAADTARLTTLLDATASSLRGEQRLTGLGALGTGGAFVALGGLALGDSQDGAIDRASTAALLGTGVVLSVGGALLIALPVPAEELREQLRESDGRAVIVIEGRLEELAKDQKDLRQLVGWTGVAAGTTAGVLSALALGVAGEEGGELPGSRLAALPLSLLVIAAGAQILLTPSAAEELWRRYAEDSGSNGIIVAPLVVRDREGGLRVGVGLGGEF